MSISNEKKTRLNREINVREVRLIDAEGEQVGVVSTREALEMAAESGMDLVEISPNAVPPVCRIMDYGKLLYEQSKQKKERKQKRTQIKEIKLRPGTDDGDYQVKLRNLIRFLEEGDKVKITLRFRGREMVHQELGVQMMDRLKIDLVELAVIEQTPRLEGRQMVMMLGPKKK